mgnify:FL=1
MPRVLSRPALREIQKPSLAPIEIIDVATEPPYSAFDYRFVNDVRATEFTGVTYYPLGWSRGPYEAETAEGVDRITIQLDDVERYWANVVQGRSIQGCRLRLRKFFLGLQSDAEDGITIFDGFAGAPSFDAPTMGFEIRSIVAYHETELPSRSFSPSCPYHLGEERCGVNMTVAPNRIDLTGGPQSSRSRLKSQALMAYPANFFAAGYIRILEGRDLGIVRPIEMSRVGEVSLYVPTNWTLEGQRVRVVRGCRKTKIECDGRFNNLNNYGGYAEVPKTPIIDV